MYQITLHDGTVLDELELNGNNFISEKVIDDSVFSGNLDTVTISNGETTETYTDMKLLSNRVDNGKSWFVLGEKTEQEKAMERLVSILNVNAESITDVQLALAEIYEMIIGGNNHGKNNISCFEKR